MILGRIFRELFYRSHMPKKLMISRLPSAGFGL